MQPKSDAELLLEYVEHDQEGAFAEIVNRHTNLVYSAALRQVNSAGTVSGWNTRMETSPSSC